MMKATNTLLIVFGILLSASCACAQNSSTSPSGVTTIHHATNLPANSSADMEAAIVKKREIESQTGKIVVTREQYQHMEMARKIASDRDRSRYHVVENLTDLLTESH